MRSIFSTILLWGVGTIAISLAGFFATSRMVESARPRAFAMIEKTQALQLEGARRALDEGGLDQLARYLVRLNEIFEAEHYLIDPSGKDLLDGTDRASMLARASRMHQGPPPPSIGPVVLTREPRDGGSRLLIVVPPRGRPDEFLAYYLWILLVVVLLGYALAVSLARPLRRLRTAVDRFGRGDLTTRIGSNRRDEIGELARSFDLMAGRIETLMAAERRLLQDVSHELRSPLARLGYAVELGRTGGDPELALDRVKRDVDRLSGLVGELLQLTTAEGDPHARVLAEVRLDELVSELAEASELEAASKGCQLVARIDGPVVLSGDRELLRRAVENVIRNAIRHAPEGSTIEVDLANGKDRTTIAVRDQGAGVPEAALISIFEPFFRVDDDRSRSSGGVGLGLSIARRAIDLHQGRIDAQNAHPGLRVVIELPRTFC